MYTGQEMWQIEYANHKASVLEKYENASTDIGYVCLGIGH